MFLNYTMDKVKIPNQKIEKWFYLESGNEFFYMFIQKISPLHQTNSTCAVLQDASAPTQFERARSGDKDQREPTVGKMATRKRACRAEVFYRNLEHDVRLKAEKIRHKIPEKMDQKNFYAIEERA